jgi:hypothetical protein
MDGWAARGPYGKADGGTAAQAGGGVRDRGISDINGDSPARKVMRLEIENGYCKVTA